MSALLAFACFPVLAQADSSELEYRDAPPAEFKKTPNKNPADSPKTGGQSATSPGSTGDPDSGGKSNDESGGIAGQKDGGGKGGPGSQTGKGDKSGVQPKEIGSIPTSTDDGSSPLAPILIALAVLAAISIGAVVMRRRRESGPGSPISPEAS